MDAFEPMQVLHTRTTLETVRRPLARANGVTPGRSRTREASSTYISPAAPFTSANKRRGQPPDITTTISSASSTLQSELRRMSLPATPVSDTVADTRLSDKNITDSGSRLPEVLRPKIMRSLSVSFQSDSISIPVSKKEEQVSCIHSDCTLKPTCNVARKPAGSLRKQRWPSRTRDPLVARSVRSSLIPGSRLASLSRTRSSKPSQTRGTSPSRVIREYVNTTTSVLSFIADVKKGKKTNHLEDAHDLWLLYNRFLQWRFANARVDAAMFIQKIIAEQTLYDVWQANLELCYSVMMKRIELERLNSEHKLNIVLRKQIGYLEDWASFEIDHTASLCGVIQDLKSSTLRLPITGGAKADVDSLKAVIRSAVGFMQTMGASICTLLPKVEGISGVISELSELAGQERSMVNECDALLASTAAMQVKEYSLRTQVVQSQQDLFGKTMQPLSSRTVFFRISSNISGGFIQE